MDDPVCNPGYTRLDKTEVCTRVLSKQLDNQAGDFY